MMDTPSRREKDALTYRIYQIGRKIARSTFVGALIPKALRSRVQSRLLRDVVDHMPDRRYMEAAILPALVALKPSRVLDVGVDTYTAHYGRWFPPEQACEYWTLDLNPAVASLRPQERHIIANVADAASHFEPRSLDVVIMNGPFGFGIDRLDEQERIIDVVRTLLRPGGRLIIGWDLAQDGRPLVMNDHGLGDMRIKDPTQLQGIRIHFRHEAPADLPARKTYDDCAHVYDWFVLA